MAEVVAIGGSSGLVREIANGSEAAFTELVALHHRDLQRVAYVICRDPDLAEDAVQAAWAIAWRRIRDLRDPDRVRPWLVAIAANEARAIVRRRSRGVIEIAVADIGELPPRRASATPEGRIDSLDLARAMAALNPTDRALLALRFVAELDSVEIGRALGLSPSGARGRLSRLLVRLREVLSDG